MRLTFLLPLAGLVVVVLVLVLRPWLSLPGPNASDASAAADGRASASDLSSTRPQPSATAGLIQGRVLFQGKLRRSPPAGRTLADVIVYLMQPSAGTEATLQASQAATASSPFVPAQRPRAILDQSGMQFFPHVAVLPQGGVLELRNSDTALHNVNGLAAVNPPFNQTLGRGDVAEVVLEQPEFIRVVCNFHSQMNAWVVVVPTEFFARVDDQGRFALEDIPSGRYTLAAWHEGVYPPYASHHASHEIEVTAGQVLEADLDFP